MRWLAILALLLTANVASAVDLVDVKNYQEQGRFVSELVFTAPVKTDSLKVEFINETIQVDVPGVEVPKGKLHKPVQDAMVRSTYTYQVNDETLRNRIIYKGVPASTFSDQVELVSTENSIKILIGAKPKAEEVVKAVGEPPRTLSTQSPEQAKDTGEDAESEILSQIDIDAIEPDLEIAKEEESIPLQLETGAKKATTSSSFARVLISMGILGVLALVAFLGIKRVRSRESKESPATQIKLLTQHYLGPKKSLAIVRVAGESILIGITDHNISMIKSLSLLDEDIPEDVPQDFTGVLGKLWERDQKKGTKDTNTKSEAKSKNRKNKGTDEDFSIEGIKDIVSNRLKDMRPIE